MNFQTPCIKHNHRGMKKQATGRGLKTPGLKHFGKAGMLLRTSLHTERPYMENNTVQLLAFLLDADRQWTVHELAVEVWVCHKTVLHILHDILGYCKLSAWWIPKFPRCNNGTTMQSHCPRWTSTKGKLMTFLDEASLLTKPGLTHTNQAWNANQMNGNILVLLVQRNCTRRNVLWRWCSLWHMTLMG